MTILVNSPVRAIAARLGRFWWVLAVIGVAWIVVGFVVLRFDNSTVIVVSVVFGVLLLLAAASEIFRAIVAGSRWRIWHTLFAVLLVVSAVLCFANPAGTFYSLALYVGFYFVFVGTFDIISSLFAVGASPVWGLQLAAGVLQLVLGFIASSSLSTSVVVLVTYVAISATFRGVADISTAFGSRALLPEAE
jgi:uncharacterized membrane protein HdeD (DUF308 family)